MTKTTKSLNPYGTWGNCPKCGNFDIRDKHREAEKGYISKNDNPELAKWFGGKDAPECIERHCRNCHYVWFEAPLDAATNGGES